jgi:hypothetical protein
MEELKKPRINYNNKFLEKLCKENDVILNHDYSSEKVTRETRIIGKCVNTDCKNSFDRDFRNMVKYMIFTCSECIKMNKYDKYKKTCLERYGVENSMHNEIMKEKCKNTILEKYGVERFSQTQECKDKIKQTCLEKYNVEYASQTLENKEKCKKTCIEKYGCQYALQNKFVRDKAKLTCIEKYGCENPFQSEKCKEKTKITCMEKYKVLYFSQSNEFKEKCKNTCLERYGCENIMHNVEIMERSSKNAYKLKNYVMSSGKKIKIQGYENFALDELLQKEKISEDDIVTGCRNVPTIWYNDESSKKHRHYVDIFIPSQNRCIEVKSTWTAKNKKNTIFLKQNAGKDLGYKYEIWIYDSKGNKVEKYE